MLTTVSSRQMPKCPNNRQPPHTIARIHHVRRLARRLRRKVSSALRRLAKRATDPATRAASSAPRSQRRVVEGNVIISIQVRMIGRWLDCRGRRLYL